MEGLLAIRFGQGVKKVCAHKWYTQAAHHVVVLEGSRYIHVEIEFHLFMFPFVSIYNVHVYILMYVVHTHTCVVISNFQFMSCITCSICTHTHGTVPVVL